MSKPEANKRIKQPLQGRYSAPEVFKALQDGMPIDANTYLTAVGDEESRRQFVRSGENYKTKLPQQAPDHFPDTVTSPILRLLPEEIQTLTLLATGHEKSAISKKMGKDLRTITSVIATIQGTASGIQHEKNPNPKNRMESINYAIKIAIEEGSLHIPFPKPLRFTRSEFTVLKLLTEGKNTKEIRELLEKPDSDKKIYVDTLIERLNNKLCPNNRRHLIAMGMMILTHYNPQTETSSS